MKGIPNAGSTCYFNAALQCIAYSPNLANYFLSGRAEEDARPKKKLASTLALALARFVRDYWTVQSAEGSADASEVYAAFTRACRGFAPHSQHDAHEAFVRMLEKVHDGLSRLKPGAHGVCHRPEVRANPWTESLDGAHSVVSEVFRGQVEVVVEAEGYTNVSHDHFTCLSLALTNCSSLTQCLTAHLAPEVVDDFKQGDATMQACVKKRFTYLPRILVIHLKRFDGFDRAAKVSRFIDYPSELDLGALCVPGCEHHYQLFGVCLHHGTMDDGHYTVCCEVKGQWSIMDDDRVEQLKNINDIIQRDAYMLLYKRL